MRDSPTSISATTPPGTPGARTVQLTTNGQTVSRPNAFTYTSSTSTPTLTLVAPNTGWTGGGTIMALTGTNFVSGATVTVGGTAATGVTFISSTLLVATAPSGTSGGKTVVVRNPNGQTASRSNGFTYRSTSGTPTFTSVTPNSGPRSGGTLVTVRGTNFLSGTGFRVRIGGYNLTNQEFVSDTEVRGRTPSNSGTGWRSLSVRNPDGLNVSVSQFSATGVRAALLWR